MFLAGEVGEPMYIRAKYGHGGRLGYEQEWRANAAVSGGGELIDQGMHLIDLVPLVSGRFCDGYGACRNLLLEHARRRQRFCHAQDASRERRLATCELD